MKILVYSKDDSVKEFCNSSNGLCVIYLNFSALKDFIANKDENLGPDELVTLVFDYDDDSEREMIDDFNSKLASIDSVFTAYISGETSLKDLRAHQVGETSANAYLFKPLGIESIEQIIEDFEASSTSNIENPIRKESYDSEEDEDEDDATVVDLNFKNLGASVSESKEGNDLELAQDSEDNTDIQNVANFQQKEASLNDADANDKIQNLFDQAFNENNQNEDNNDLKLSGELEADSLSDKSEVLEGIEPLNHNEEHDETALLISDQTDAEISMYDKTDEFIINDEETSNNIEIEDIGFDISDEEMGLEKSTDHKENLSFDIDSKQEVNLSLDESVEEYDDESDITAMYNMDTSKLSPEDLVENIPSEVEEIVETVKSGLETSEEVLLNTQTPMSLDPVKEDGLNFSIPENSEPEELSDNKEHTSSEIFSMPRMNENEALRYQATIAQLREERNDLLETIHKQKQEIAVNHQDGLGTKAELEEAKIEISIMKKRYMSEVEDMKYRLKIANDKKEYTEEKNKFLEKEFSRLEQRVRVDVNQIQQREKELEGQLELVKIDSESQVQTRDKKILDLKRKIDQLEFNMENAAIREQKSRDDKVHLEDRLDKIMRTLRGSIEVLEDDMNWTDEDKEKR